MSLTVVSKTPVYLDWRERPEELKSAINTSFQKLATLSESGWGVYNGDDSYRICGVNELKLLKKTIVDAYPHRKDFYVLDIGAGNFQWNTGVADFIEKQTDLPKDIKVHIVGVRGESYWGQRFIETERCKIYNFGAFKVEELFAKFKGEGLDLENKVDVAISHWCFRHLNDSVGTFLQTVNLLRPKTGYFLVDGFFFLRNEEEMGDVGDFNLSITRLFLDTKAPFLTQYFDQCRSLNHFILRRPDENRCRIPMSYSGSSHPVKRWQIGSENVTRFKRELQPDDREEFRIYNGELSVVTGDKAMYEQLKQNGLLESRDLTWKPMHAKQDHLMQPPLHQVVIRDDVDAVEELLKKGDDINESDTSGCTPLHLAIQNKCFKVFQLLLDRGANIDLCNGKKRAALNEAAFWDREGVFVQALIDAGAPVNPEWFYGIRSPLTSAIQAKNYTAVEILIKNGVEVSEDDHQDLRDPAFVTLRQKGLIPSKKGNASGFAQVFRWIEEGNCVLLHYNGSEEILYNHPHEQNTTPKLIMCDINPSTRLLAEGEWPTFLELKGYKPVPCNKENTDVKFKVVEHYQFGYNS